MGPDAEPTEGKTRLQQVEGDPVSSAFAAGAER